MLVVGLGCGCLGAVGNMEHNKKTSQKEDAALGSGQTSIICLALRGPREFCFLKTW